MRRCPSWSVAREWLPLHRLINSRRFIVGALLVGELTLSSHAQATTPENQDNPIVSENDHGMSQSAPENAPETLFIEPPLVFNSAATMPGEHLGFYRVQSYFDHQGVDPMCGPLTYPGHRGTDLTPSPFPATKFEYEEVSVVSATSGIVIRAEDGNEDDCMEEGGLGNNVLVMHPETNTYFYYGHLKKDTVPPFKNGEWIEAGTFLGHVGMSGYTDGPHLHLEIRHEATDGPLIDPVEGPCNPTPKIVRFKDLPAYDAPQLQALLVSNHKFELEASCGDPWVWEGEYHQFCPGEKVYFTRFYDNLFPGNFEFKYSVVDSNGEFLSPDTADIVDDTEATGLAPEFTRHNNYARWTALELPDDAGGEFWFVAKNVKGEEIGNYPFEINPDSCPSPVECQEDDDCTEGRYCDPEKLECTLNPLEKEGVSDVPQTEPGSGCQITGESRDFFPLLMAFPFLFRRKVRQNLA